MGQVARSMRRRVEPVLAWASLAVLLGPLGCHHRRAQPVLLPPQTPVALEQVPETLSEPLVEVPATKLPAVPVAQSAGKPKKTKKRPARTTTGTTVAGTTPTTAPAGATAKKGPEPSTTAPATKSEPPVAEIGALSVGGEQSPKSLQEAKDQIASNERRLAALSAETARTQVQLIAKVRNFQKDAEQALTSGDAEGAKTLATKGKLLLDDLEKAGTT